MKSTIEWISLAPRILGFSSTNLKNKIFGSIQNKMKILQMVHLALTSTLVPMS